MYDFLPSPILISFGAFTVRWYGVFLALATGVGLYVLHRLVRHTTFERSWLFDVMLRTILFGFIGARLYHVLNEPQYYATHVTEILAVWHGGLAIHGGIIAGFLTLLFSARKRGLSVWQLTDLAAPALAIGQAIGRWGNYFNQELFGTPTAAPWGIPILPAYRPAEFAAATHFHPTFLYESLWNVFVFGVLLLLFRKKRTTMGFLTAAYIALAGLGRFGTELLRIDDTPVILGMRLPLLVSAALFVAGTIGIIVLSRKRHAHTH